MSRPSYSSISLIIRCRLAITFYAYIFFVTSTYGQFALTGMVKGTSDGNPVSYASVVIQLPDDDTTYKGVLTDSSGFFLIDQIYWRDSMDISATQIGFAVQKVRFKSPAFGDTLNIDFILNEQVNELPTATVKEKRIQFSISGDTIAFNPEAYLLGNERTLGDLIRNIPELELNSAGEIRYQGKTVDAVLIEGLDVFNGRQRSATEDIGVEHILEIEVVTNYQRFGDLLSGEKQKTAVNVRLKGKSKSKWIGRHQLGVATNMGGKGDIGYTNVRKGINFKFSANATGEAALTARDYLNISGGINPEVGRSKGNFKLDEQLPRGLVLPKALKENEDYLLSFGVHRPIGKKVMANAGFVGTVANRDTRRTFERMVFGNQESGIAGDEEGGQSLNFGFGKLTLAQKKSAQDSSSRLSLKIEGAQTDVGQVVNQVTTQIANYQTTQDLKTLSGATALSWQASKNKVWKHSLKLLTEIENRINRASINAPTDRILINQNVSVSRLDHQADIRNWRHQLFYSTNATFKVWDIEHKLVLSKENSKYRVNASENIFEYPLASARDHTMRSRSTIRYKWEKFQVSLVNTLSTTKRNWSGVDLDAKVLRKSSVYLQFRESPFHFAILRLYNENKFANNLLASTKLTEITDERTVTQYNASANQLHKITGTNISYFNRNLFGKRLTAIVTTGYSFVSSGNFQMISQKGDLFYRSFSTLKGARSYNSTIRLILPLLKWLHISASNAFINLQQHPQGVDNTNLILSTRVREVSVSVLDIDNMKISLSYSGRSNSQTVGTQEFHAVKNDIGVAWQVERNGHSILLSVMKRITAARQESFSNYIINGKYDYKLKNSKWRLFLKGENISQFNPSLLNEGEVTSNAFTLFRYRTFPGFIMIGAEIIL